MFDDRVKPLMRFATGLVYDENLHHHQTMRFDISRVRAQINWILWRNGGLSTRVILYRYTPSRSPDTETKIES